MVQRENKKNTEVFNVDRLFRMPPGTTTLSLKPDTEDELLGVFEIPQDAQARARKAALEEKREKRDRARQEAKNDPPEAKSLPDAKQELSDEALLQERAEELKSTMRGPAAARVNDLVLYCSKDSGRWLLGNIMSLTGRGRRRKAVLQL